MNKVEEMMSTYKQMYYRLFNRVTDAIGALRTGDASRAQALLIAAQQEAEESYLSSGGEKTFILNPSKR